MPLTMNYTVLNSQMVTVPTPVQVGGNTITIPVARREVEASPDDGSGKTLTFICPIGTEEEFPADSKLTMTIEAIADEEAA